MQNKRKKILPRLALLVMLPASMIAAQEIHSNAEAINVAGKQRMYTMRMLRDYLMIGEKLNYKDPAGDLKKTIADFDEAGKALQSYVKDPKLMEEMKGIHQIWTSSRKMFSQPPVKEKALAYTKDANAFRKKLNTFVNDLSAHYGSSTAEVVNTAGRLRAVSQALAALYQLKAWGIKEASEMIKKPMKSFRDGLDYLDKAKETQASMRPILTKLERTYLFFKIMDDASDTATPALVIKETDRMLKLANTLTGQYLSALKQ